MESPEDIEKALARLVPSAISDRGQRSLEDLIDSLAAGESAGEEALVEMPQPRRKPWRWIGGIGAAAAAVALALVIPAGTPEDSASFAANPIPREKDGFLVLGQSKHVESAVPEDWTSEADGVTHRAWRVRVVNQERVQDLETGYEVLVSQPQEEVILRPVNTF
jgi:hypothetical protein